MKETAESRLALVDLGAQIRAAAANADSNGEFEGLACAYGVRDTYGTTFMPGCFSAGTDLTQRFAFLSMHDPRLPLGTFTAEEREDGLWIQGRYSKTERAQEHREMAIDGTMPGLSVGFVRLIDPEDPNWEEITHARLVETSQIVLGMASVPGSELKAVRSALKDEYTAPEIAVATTDEVRALSNSDEALIWRLRTA